MAYTHGRGVVTAAVTALVLAATAPVHAEPRDPWARAWGGNGAGRLGNGTLVAQQTPAGVQGLARADVRELAAGGGNDTDSFAVALLDDGTDLSWGGNGSGQLGGGTTVGRPFPAAVALSGVSDVAAGLNSASAVRGGRVLARGDNAFGRLANGSAEASPRPAAVQSLDKVRDIASGRSHSLARTADGTVKAWGYNSNGQLGDDSTEHGSVPVDVQHLTDVARIYAAGYHSFAVLDDEQVRAWGWNGAGHLGDGSTVSRTTPVPVPGLTDVTAMAGGYHHTLAVLADGSVLAWGENTLGQLGDGTTTNSPTPVTALPPGSGTTRVAVSKVFRTSYAY
ncbi:RCC1 domain-containing protein [Streptomyces sp. NPDC059556]|uniref:RCC1 domain-containing protein n=1 Tax=Streptomyces sp. NPDC059556 TaxID=3346863 RepID=UPI0036BC189E